MDAELAALASTAATTMVKALTSDGWESVKSGVAALWRRAHPEHTATLEAELVDTHTELLAAREVGDGLVEQGLAEDWERKLRRLLASHPELKIELRLLVQEQWHPLLSPTEQQQVTTITMRAAASGKGRTYQAGVNMNIIER